MNIKLGKKEYNLNFSEFESDIDVDGILSINYTAIVAELLTFPVVLNKFGILLAEAESNLKEVNLKLEIRRSFFSNKFKQRKIKTHDGRFKAPTQADLDNWINQEPEILDLLVNLQKREKERDYVKSIFWSAKHKSNLLEKMAMGIKAGDIDSALLPKKINGVHIITI